MAMREQERRSPPLETTQAASDEPELMTTPGPMAGGSAATSMATAGAMAGSAAAREEERGAEGGIARSPSAWAALLSAASSTHKVLISAINASPHFERKPRTHVHRAAAPSPHWLGFRLPVLPVPPAPAKKKGKPKMRRDMPCVLCGAVETPLWRTWPTDRRVALCNACGIQVRTLPPGVVLPELVYLPHPATATAAVSDLEHPVAPAEEIQPVKGNSPGAALPKQVRVNLPPPAMAATTVVPELEQPVAPAQEIQPVKGDSPGAAHPKQVRVNLPAPAMAATAVVPALEPPVAPAQEIQPVKGDSPGAALPKQVRVNLPPPAMAAATVVPELEQPHPQEIQESESEPEPDSPLDDMLDTEEVYLVKRTLPRREKTPPPPPSPLPPPPTAEVEPEPAPGNDNDKQPARCCQHCGATSTRQWRMGPQGEKTLCNPCGVRYMRGGLVPEYRPKESPSFDGSVHSNAHRAVLQIRQLQDNPVAPAEYQRIRARRKRRNSNGQQQPAQAQVGKKRKEQNQPVLPVREKSKRIEAKEQHRQPPQPAAATQLRAGNDMLVNLDLNLPPPPPPALPLAGGGIEREQRLPAELLQHTTGNMEMEEQDLPPPPPPLALPHAGGELMRDEDVPVSPLDPWLLEGTWPPMLFEDEPVEVIVIDDD